MKIVPKICNQCPHRRYDEFPGGQLHVRCMAAPGPTVRVYPTKPIPSICHLPGVSIGHAKKTKEKLPPRWIERNLGEVPVDCVYMLEYLCYYEEKHEGKHRKVL